MGGMGLKLAPMLVGCLLSPLSLSGPIPGTSRLKATLNRYNPPPAAQAPTPSPYIHATHDIVAVKIVTHNSAVLTS